jgi:hypothetical protein
LYYGTAGAALSAMTEITKAKDVTVTPEPGEIDATTRANLGYTSTEVGLLGIEISFALQWDNDNTICQALRAACYAKTPLEFAALTAEKADTAAEGPKGAFVITGFVHNAPLANDVTIDVTLKLQSYSDYIDNGVS